MRSKKTSSIIPIVIFCLLLSFISCAKNKETTKRSPSISNNDHIVSETATGFAIPKSIQVIPSDQEDSNTISIVSRIGKALRTSKLTDYERDIPELKVSVSALDQFQIIEYILKTLDQTLYYHEDLINSGPYKAIVTWTDSRETTIEEWIIDSKMIKTPQSVDLDTFPSPLKYLVNKISPNISLTNHDTNKIVGWIPEKDQTIYFEMYILSPSDEINNYGTWLMNVCFIKNGTFEQQGYFVAASYQQKEDDKNVIVINQEQKDDISYSMKGKMILTNNEGKGIVHYPDFEGCLTWPCEPENTTIQYAYTENHIIYQKENESANCKSRNSYSDIYTEYNLYNVDQSNIRTTKNFGVPLKYTNDDNKTIWYYYNISQDRHHLYGPFESNALPENALLVRTDTKNGDSYNFEKYSGYLVKKELINTNLTDIEGEILTAQITSNFSLRYVGGSWKICNDKNSDPSHRCDSLGGNFDINDLSQNNSKEDRHFFVFLSNPNSSQVSGLVELDETGYLKLNDEFYSPSAMDTLWVWLSEKAYLQYNGDTNQWKSYTNIGENSWNPEFSQFDAGTIYTIKSNDSIYLWGQGLNYTLEVNTTPTVTYQLKKEIETVVKPDSILNGQLDQQILTDERKNQYRWDGTNLMLRNENNEIVTSPIWKLTDLSNNLFTWQYAEQGQDWNTLTYLINSGDGSYLILDDPIHFAPITFTSTDGSLSTKLVTIDNLAFDGHLYGLPDAWSMINSNNFQLNSNIKSKIINIPAGTVLTDRDDGITTYMIKPRFGYRILDTVPIENCDATLGTVTIDDLPEYTETPHTVSSIPDIQFAKVSNGQLLIQKNQ